MNLAAIFVHPTLLEVPTGSGTIRSVLPFTLGDLAYLESVVAHLSGFPLAGERVKLRTLKEAAGGDYLGDSPESLAYAEAVREFEPLVDDPSIWPPGITDEVGASLLATAIGRAHWLYRLLSRTDPAFGMDQAYQLLAVLDDESRLALEAVAYGRHPAEEISQLLGQPPDAPEINWGEVIWDVIKETGWTFGEVAALTLNQLGIVRNCGKSQPGGLRGSESWIDREGERRMRLFWRGAGNG